MTADTQDSRITRTSLRVRGFHLDVYDHVNNARYLEFLEEGRWAYFDEHLGDADTLRKGVAMVAVNLNINYRQGAVLGDDLEVHTMLSRISGRSAVMHQTIHRVRDGAPVVDADLTFVLLDMHTQKPLPIEGVFLETFEPLLVSR